jgi:hypothetical protein
VGAFSVAVHALLEAGHTSPRIIRALERTKQEFWPTDVLERVDIMEDALKAIASHSQKAKSSKSARGPVCFLSWLAACVAFVVDLACKSVRLRTRASQRNIAGGGGGGGGAGGGGACL